jgi:hypothetical protein
MPHVDAPGFHAGWLNGWLAAIGVTVLVPDLALRWTDDGRPHACFDGDDVVERLVAAFPSLEQLGELAITRQASWSPVEFERKPSVGVYAARATRARAGDHSLSSTVTDLAPRDDEVIQHSPFDPSAPQGITIHQRLVSCRAAIDDVPSRLAASFTGNGARAPINGLGFDYSRLFAPTVPGSAVWCEPVVEVLAFYGMVLLPVRGDGVRVRPRGWSGPPTRRGSFTWPAWRPALRAPAIDALLDRFWAGHRVADVHAEYRSVAYQPRGSADATRGFGSERVR